MSGGDPTPTQLAPGVHRLGSEWINWYVIEDGGRIVVVDTAIPGYYDQLERALAGIGRTPSDVEVVLLTHHHNDHVGCAERIRAQSGARVLAPEIEAPMIRGDEKPHQPDGVISNLWRPALLRFMVHAARNGGAKVKKVAEVETYGSGETLEDVPGRPSTIGTPGHSPGHHSLHFPEHGVLFTGDAMASISWVSGETGPQLHPFGEDRERMPASLDVLEPIEAALVCFGHGEPFRGSPEQAVANARRLAG